MVVAEFQKLTQPYFSLDLVYNFVFEFVSKKQMARHVTTPRPRIFLGSISCGQPRRDTSLQELTFAR